MSSAKQIQGLCLKVGPLGENDRLLTLLSDEEGTTRLAVPGARRPRSSLSAAAPLNLLKLQVVGRSSSLKKIRQLTLLHSFTKVGQHLETLAAAQVLAELSLLLVANNDPISGMLSTVLAHLERLEYLSQNNKPNPLLSLAISVQSCIHLLALGGYGVPVQECCKSGAPLDPPIGQWDWKCSLIPEEGIAIGPVANAAINLNPSELALLQRLLQPNLPKKKDGELLGPKEVWIRLLFVVQVWMDSHLAKKVRALDMLKEIIIS